MRRPGRAGACLAGLCAVLLAPACADRPIGSGIAAGGATRPGGGTPADARAPVEKEVSRPLPFIADDAPRALAEAKRRGLPIFVEAWAPW